ncbi:MAG: DUF4132 domain-containing protein [Bryobacterales bacterium]
MSAEFAVEAILTPLMASENFWEVEAKSKTALEAARTLEPEDQVALAIRAAQRATDQEGLEMGLQPFLSGLLRKKLPFDSSQATALVDAVTRWRYGGPLLPVLNAAANAPQTPELRAALARLRAHPYLQSGYAELAKPIAKLDELLGEAKLEASDAKPGPWMLRVRESLRGSDMEFAVRKLFLLGQRISSGKPAQKWLAEANQLVGLCGREAFRERALEWLAIGPSPVQPPAPVDSAEGDEQRALLWALTDYRDREVCAAVATFTEKCLTKVPMVGAVSAKVGNAGVNVLAEMASDPALAQLARLSARVRYSTAQRLIAKALEEGAERAGLTRDELEERTVPDFGLDAEGRWVRRVGGYSLELDVHNPTLRVVNSEGKVLKSIPAALKAEHADEIKRARAAGKELVAMLATHRLRIERLLMTGRRIPLDVWREHYLEHPLVQELTRRLIWRFRWTDEDRAGFWRDGKLEEWNGLEISPGEDATVELWHPIHAKVEQVLAWRCRLEDLGVVQPFKQAHREVYLLTAAERVTGDHSNRFAAHILSQHQFAALAQARGWGFTLMGAWDSHNTPTLELPHAELEACLNVETAAEDAVSDHAVYLFVTTGSVMFTDAHLGTPVRLQDVPVAVFSEVMRDVDLFTGVTSVASDPTWSPGRWRDIDAYRDQRVFGDLSLSAQNRREILAGLLPQLPFAERASLDDKFLTIRGSRCTYKIHLGSANVMIEPGSRYLCIVRGGGDKTVALPFEGDTTLTMILSKALLLANDAKISDRSILSQLPPLA